jgi:hypothetical protein
MLSRHIAIVAFAKVTTYCINSQGTQTLASEYAWMSRVNRCWNITWGFSKLIGP